MPFPQAMHRRAAAPAQFDPARRARLSAEVRPRWARAGYPTLVQHILGLIRTALGGRGYQALIVIDAALRHQLGRHAAGEPERVDPGVSGF